MLRLLADENFDNDLIRRVLRRMPTCDIVGVQDVGLSGADDPTVLAWAAQAHAGVGQPQWRNEAYFVDDGNWRGCGSMRARRWPVWGEYMWPARLVRMNAVMGQPTGNAEGTGRPPAAWPASLARIGAVRFARRYYRFKEAVRFYRDLVGLPVCETFEGSYGSNGVIFGLPDASLTFEVVESDTPVVVDPHEQICLYFPDAAAREAARQRLTEAGIEPVVSHPYWVVTGAVTYRDPDGRELVFAPFVYGRNEPEASFADGEHGFPSA